MNQIQEVIIRFRCSSDKKEEIDRRIEELRKKEPKITQSSYIKSLIDLDLQKQSNDSKSMVKLQYDIAQYDVTVSNGILTLTKK